MGLAGAAGKVKEGSRSVSYLLSLGVAFRVLGQKPSPLEGEPILDVFHP
jgi:hypothetical protein